MKSTSVLPGNRQVDRLTVVSVKGLHGRFTHCVPMHSSGITLVHGPNGCGKSTLLRLVQCVLDNNPHGLLKYRFDELALEFERGTSLIIRQVARDPEQKRQSENDAETHLASVMDQWLDWGESEDSYALDVDLLVFIDGRLIKQPIKQDPSRRSGHLEDELHRLTSGRMLRHAPNRRGSDVDRPAATFADEVVRVLGLGVQFIGSDRLSNQMQPKSRRAGVHAQYRESINVPAIEIRADMARDMLRRMHMRSALRGQDLDRTFITRALFEESEMSRTEEEVRQAYALQQSQWLQIAEAGLLERDTQRECPHPSDELRVQIARRGFDRSFNMPDLPTEAFERVKLRAVEVYTRDIEAKLQPYAEMLQRAELLLEIINRHFDGKTIGFDPWRGLIVQDSKGDIVPLTGLSSGEQHEVVLNWDMIFTNQRMRQDDAALSRSVGGQSLASGDESGSHAQSMVFLIDEPEISLHVEWQREFMHDLTRIAHISGHQFVVATHSPQIAGDFGDHMVRLRS